MSKAVIAYPLRVYDQKLWERIQASALRNKVSMNAEIASALVAMYPDPDKKKSETKKS